MSSTLVARAAGAALALAACSGRPGAPASARLGPAIAAALAAADQAREPWRCAAPDGPGVADETLTAGTRTWQLGAHVMKLAAPGDVAIGVIADAAGSAPETLAALGRLRARLARVDLVISLGGMGATRAELEAAFAALTDRATWPLVALPGDLEPVSGLSEAIARARQRGAAVVDGRLVQRIELPAATIALVPGASAASRLVGGRRRLRLPSRGRRRRVRRPHAAGRAAHPGVGRGAARGRTRRADRRARHDGRRRSTDRHRAARAPEWHDDGTTSDGATPAQSGDRDGAAVSLSPGSSDATPRLPGSARTPRPPVS